MRRTPIVLVMTAAGLTGLAALQDPPGGQPPRRAIAVALCRQRVASASGTVDLDSDLDVDPADLDFAIDFDVGHQGEHRYVADHPHDRPGDTLAPATTTTTTVPSTTTTTPATTRSATGEVVDYSYGTLSVSVTVSGHTISKVSIASLDDGGNFRSQSIDQQSIPILEQETLQAQSANIQSVSGASYTSQGFAQSLQSALYKLGF